MSKVITPEAILSYPALDEPQPVMGDSNKLKYGCALIFPEGTDLKAMKKAATAAAKERWGNKGTATIRNQKNPLFRTDAKDGYPEGCTFINVRSDRQPGVVSVYPDPDNEGKPLPIAQDKIKEEMYPGCRVRASLTAFAYDVNGNKGVSFGLNNIQKLGEGERLDGRVAAEDEFEADADAVADLDDLTNQDDDVVGDLNDDDDDDEDEEI